MAAYTATARLERAPVRIRSAPDGRPSTARDLDPSATPASGEPTGRIDELRERLADLRASFDQTTFFLLDSESWR